MKFLFFLIFGLSISAQSIKPNALLKRTEHALKEIQTVTYIINQKTKSFSAKDTLYNSGICSLYIMPNDKMGAYHILNMKQLPSQVFSIIKYDCEYASQVLYKQDSLDAAREVFLNNVNQNNNIGGIGYNLLLRDYFVKQNIFKQYRSLLAKFFLKKITVTEGEYLKTPVYILTIYGKDKPSENRINSSVDTYYIRKSDYLPIAHSFYGEFEGMKETQLTEIDYLDINNQMNLESFKIDTSLKEMNPRKFFDELQKHNL